MNTSTNSIQQVFPLDWRSERDWPISGSEVQSPFHVICGLSAPSLHAGRLPRCLLQKPRTHCTALHCHHNIAIKNHEHRALCSSFELRQHHCEVLITKFAHKHLNATMTLAKRRTQPDAGRPLWRLAAASPFPWRRGGGGRGGSKKTPEGA